MRIIFSRKGFDSAAGGQPSPIVDGHPISLPIPTRMPSSITYDSLPPPIPDLVTDLTKGRVSLDQRCHVDPDLDSRTIRRKRGWRGSLGQVSRAQSHLANHDVGVGDLFLFWGLFRPVEYNSHWRFNGPREHRIFGWLRIGAVEHVGADPRSTLRRYPWLLGHPHALPGWPGSNTLYIARKTLDLSATVKPGWGVFPTGRRLTVQNSKQPSLWRVPEWLHPLTGGVGMTFHPAGRWLNGALVRAAARGQEFVADIGAREDALIWLNELFEEPA